MGAVESSFLPCDSEVILRIPLVDRVVEDRIVWYYEKNGMFSVRSAYKALSSRKEAELNKGDVVDASDERSLWKWVWRLPIMPRTRSFI